MTHINIVNVYNSHILAVCLHPHKKFWKGTRTTQLNQSWHILLSGEYSTVLVLQKFGVCVRGHARGKLIITSPTRESAIWAKVYDHKVCSNRFSCQPNHELHEHKQAFVSSSSVPCRSERKVLADPLNHWYRFEIFKSNMDEKPVRECVDRLHSDVRCLEIGELLKQAQLEAVVLLYRY